jgi:hypothetical protein
MAGGYNEVYTAQRLLQEKTVINENGFICN